MTSARLEAAYQSALRALLAERHADGYWVGELSTSALSTATAVMALHLVNASGHADMVSRGIAWLADQQNADGGWGDTDKSISNISTTMLCRSALYLTGNQARRHSTVERAENWLFARHGRTPEQLAEAVRSRYGKDRTFAVPILTTCALAGLVAWSEVPPLPFELACLPQSWFRFVRLHVVSYALPALIAIGQAVHQHRGTWNPLTLVLRWLAKGPSLQVLRAIQPASGGYLEATPLTSFVTLSLASIGLGDHAVARSGVDFLIRSVRPDGSWPIDTNLSTWVTTLALNALATAGELDGLDQKDAVADWLRNQQYEAIHPYTGAAPGGWAWTPLSGGVPDGDDTPGAILALLNLDRQPTVHIKNGLRWLRALQNSDGGWPTFCRGWGHLPFDRSGSDLTAHALRALHRAEPGGSLQSGLDYLARTQRADGSWLPLWFGNQHGRDDENPTYGTARVLAAYRDLQRLSDEPAQRGIRWLLQAQNSDGGWGGGTGTPSSLEETALAVEVLFDAGRDASATANKGTHWLIERIEAGGLFDPTPIGFYFAKLWYYERLYPIIFAVAALGKARRSS